MASNYRSGGTLDDYLAEHGVLGIEGIDTRALVRLTRERGALKGILSTTDPDDARLVAKAKASPGLVGRDLTAEVMPDRRRRLGARASTAGSGSKSTARPRPARPAARRRPRLRDEVEHPPPPGRDRLPGHGRARLDPRRGLLDHEPDGIFLSNGPGDPAALTGATATSGR